MLLVGCASPQFSDAEADDAGADDAGADVSADGGPDDARFDDAGADDDALVGPVDAAPPPVLAPSFPAWAAKMVGRYAYRTRLFVQAGSVVAHSDALGFATVTRAVDGALELEVSTCETITQSSLASMRVTYPELLPKRLYRMEFDGDVFRASLRRPVAAGFLYEALERCRGKEGMRVEKDPSQVWIRGDFCTCAENVDLLVGASDCRVRDTDGDREPGFRLEGSGAASGVYGGAIAFKHDFVMGTRRSDGSLLAYNDERSVNYQLTGSAGPWTTNRACPPGQNATEFVRAPDEETCAALIGQRSKYFPIPPPAPPERCF